MSIFKKIGLKCCAVLLLTTMGTPAFYAVGNGTPPPVQTAGQEDDEEAFYDPLDLERDLLEGRRDVRSLSDDELKEVIPELWATFFDYASRVRRSLDLSLKLNETPSLGMEYPVSYVPYANAARESDATPVRIVVSETLIQKDIIPDIVKFASQGEKTHNRIINEVCNAVGCEVFARTTTKLWDAAWERCYYASSPLRRFDLDISTGKNREFSTSVSEGWKLNTFISFLGQVDDCIAEGYSNSWRFSPVRAHCGSSYLIAREYINREQINPRTYWINLAKTLIEKSNELKHIYKNHCAPWHWSDFGYLYLR